MVVTCVERGLDISKSPAFVAEEGNTLVILILSNQMYDLLSRVLHKKQLK